MTKSYNVLPCLFRWARGSFWASAAPGERLRWLLKLFWKKCIFRKCAILQKVVMNESLQHEEESSMRRDNEMATSLWDLGRPWKSLRKQNDLVVSETRGQRWTKMIDSIWLQFLQTLFVWIQPQWIFCMQSFIYAHSFVHLCMYSPPCVTRPHVSHPSSCLDHLTLG